MKINLKSKKSALIICALIITTLITITMAIVTISVKKENYRLNAPINIREENGFLLWDAVDDAKGYSLKINDDEYSAEENIFSLAEFAPGEYTVFITAISNRGSQYNGVSNAYTFMNRYRGIQIVPLDTKIEKEYDNSTEINIEIVRGVHYEILNLRYGDKVELVCDKIQYNSPNVNLANEARIYYNGMIGEDADNYAIDPGSFVLVGVIKPKVVEIEIPTLTKEFLDEDRLDSEITIDDETIEITYVRELGEDIGYYDILDVYSHNPNFIFTYNKEDGQDKYEISKKLLNIRALSECVLKVYDGTTAFDESLLQENIDYKLDKLDGYDVEIQLVSAEFNSKDVATCEILIVKCNSELSKGIEYYELSSTEFCIPARIEPLCVDVAPILMCKQFGDQDALIQNVNCALTGEDFNVQFKRVAGETIGFYDVTEALSQNPNYNARMLENSGLQKFEIVKRKISVKANPSTILSKGYDGNCIYSQELSQGYDYYIENLVDGYEASVRINNVLFDSPDVGENKKAIAAYSAELNSGGEFYSLISGSLDFNATVTPKIITYEVPYFSKQFGDADLMKTEFYDEEIGNRFEIVFDRIDGENVGVYSITSASCSNGNYTISPVNGTDKFEIVKRVISVSPKDITVQKEYDDKFEYNLTLDKNTHYEISNVPSGYETDITIKSAVFNSKTVNATSLSIEFELQSHTDKFVLQNHSIILNGRIKPKTLKIIPTQINVQYGDAEALEYECIDTDLNITVGYRLSRQSGNNVGHYDILSATSYNSNYIIIFDAELGKGKYNITARKLNVKPIDGISFSKKYDGSTDCKTPITQGFHYELENLIGGTEVVLRIISAKYNSLNVLEATKIIVYYSAMLSGADGENYETTEGAFEFPAHISPRELTITPNKFVKKYSETDYLQQSFYDSETGETITAVFAREDGESVGLYSINDVSTDNANFKFFVSEGENKFEIVRNDITIKVKDKDVYYNGKAFNIDEPIVTPNKDVIIKYSRNGEPYQEKQPINAGVYNVAVEFQGDDCYNPNVTYCTLTIERIASVITNETPNNYIYDGTEKQIKAHLNHSEAAITYSVDSIINAGEYNILLSVPQTENYNAASMLIQINIAKRIVTEADLPNIIASDITYGQPLSMSNLIYECDFGKFTWADPNIYPTVNNNGYEVKFETLNENNYEFTGGTAYLIPLNVKKATVEIPAPISARAVYGDKLSTVKLIGDSLYGLFEWENPEYILTEKINKCKVIFNPYDIENYEWETADCEFDVDVSVYYPIKFDTCGGNSLSNVLVDTLTSAPIPIKKGYVFDGWYFDDQYKQPVIYPYSVNALITFYALWHPEGIIFERSSDGAFYKVKGVATVADVAIPASYKRAPVREILSSAFENNSVLKRIVIPSSVTLIGNKAFSNCHSLREIHICNDIEQLTLGIDWNKTGNVNTDIHYSCNVCEYCDGGTDCHINCRYCEYCGNVNGEHNRCPECGVFCVGNGIIRFCVDCGVCSNCAKQCADCHICVNCNLKHGKLVCPDCFWCSECNLNNGFGFCHECGKCDDCFNLCSKCGNCVDHCKCNSNIMYKVQRKFTKSQKIPINHLTYKKNGCIVNMYI